MVIFHTHGGVHTPDSLNFYKSIGAPQRVQSIARDGFKLPFESKMPPFWYKNNESANKEMDLVRKKVYEWVSDGYVDKVDFKPKYISPISLATRTTHTGEIKKRVCLDATFINKHLIKESTKMPTLKDSEILVKPGDYGVCLDLANCYFHIALSKEDYGKVAFALPKEENPEEYEFFIFLVMIYGLSPSAFVINMMTKPLIDLLLTIKIKTIIFIDDQRVTQQPAVQLEKDIITVKQVFNAAGWIFQDSKQTAISNEYIYLGFVFNTNNMRYSVPYNRITQLESLINQIPNSGRVEPKFLAKIAGKIISMEIATSMLPRLQIWPYFKWIVKVIKTDLDWKRKFNISKSIKDCMSKALLSIRKYSGEIRLKDYNYKYVNIADLPYYPNKKDTLMAGDGNELYGAWYNVKKQEKYEIIKFQASEACKSSSYKELLVFHSCVKKEKRSFEHRNVVFYTDSRVLYFWFTYGSTIQCVAVKLIEIYQWTLDNKVCLEVVWKPRSDKIIELADASSRSDSDEYSLPSRVYQKIVDTLEVDLKHDLFASSISQQKFPTFYSKNPTLGSIGCDALKFDWSEFPSYCFPPKNLLFKVFKKIEATKILDIVLIIMKTRHNTVFNLFVDENGQFKPYVKKCLTFDSRVYSPIKCSKFTTELHTWYVLHINKGTRKYNLKLNDIVRMYI